MTLTSDTGAIVSLGNAAYEQLADGVILSVSPSEGQLGTLITIKGERLLGGVAKFHSVKLNGVAVLKFISGNSTQIIARADASAALGSGAVLLTSDSGAEVRLGSGWTYNAHSTVKTVEPATGQYGTKVLLSGTNLLGVTSGKEIVKVTLAGVEAKIVSGESQTEIAVVAQRPTEARKGDVHILADSGAYFTGAAFEYVEAAEVKLVEPAYGQIDTRVAITGSNLLAGGAKIVSVTLDGVAATVRNSSNTEVLVTVQHKELAVNQTTSTGNVVMTVDTGAIITAKDGWTYRLASAVQTITPAFGHGGTRVEIAGKSLRGHGGKVVEVRLAGIKASITDETDGVVNVVAAASKAAVRGSVLLIADSGATTTEEKAWDYGTPGGVSKVEPNFGHYGTDVVITGTHLRGHSAAIKTVSLGGVVSRITDQTDSKIALVAQYGPKIDTLGDVVITAVSGAVISAPKTWTYIAAGVIRSIVPALGQHGTNVIVSGSNLCGGGTSIQSLTLGGVTATLRKGTSCAVVLSTAQVLDNNASSVKGDVVITSNTGAVVTKTEGWTYLVRSKIATITPFAGVTGTRVTIAGINLLGGGAKASVTLNGISATVVDQSADSVVVLANPGEGKGTVQITSETGAVVWLKDSWTYSKLASIAPSNGQFGTRVTMTGVGLRGGGDAVTAVHVCNTLAKLTAQTDTSIGFVVPVVTSVVPPEKCDVVATSGDFNTKITLLDGLTYRVPGEVKKVSPDSGHHGTRVVVNGADLFGGGEKLVSITLNGVVAKVTGASNTEIAAVANPNSAGKGNVVITSDSGAVVTGVDMFTYVAQADITDMQDETGQLGSVTTIVGQNLRMNGATFEVTLAGVKAQMMKATEGEFKVRAAGSTPQQGDVRIVADTGAFVREVNGWTFADAGKVTSVEPNNGWTDFEVLITGSNLRGQGSYVKNVTMAGVTAKIVAENNTAISVVVQEPKDRYAKTVGDVVITADTGAVITFENGWTYNVAGKVAAVTPNNGREGSRITIKGSDLLGRGSS